MTPEGWRKATYGHAMTEIEQRAEGATDLPVLSVTKTRGPMLASERFGKVMHGRDLGKYRVAPRDYVVADPMLLWDGSIGLQTVVDAGLVSPDYRVYKPAPEVDPKFLGYLVRSPLMLPHYQGGARGTNVRRNRIARSDFLAIPVGLPPLGEQKKIAAILSSVDEAIEATQAVIDRLQVVKKAMMAELLTRGLPGRHTRFKQTEIGEVPDEWDVAALGTVCKVTSGGTPSRDNPAYWNGGVPWVKTGEINYGTIYSTEETISELGVANSSAKRVPKGALLMAMYGQGATRGRVAILGVEATLNQACLAMLPGGRASCRFLFHVFSDKYDELRSMGNEGTQKNLSATLIKEVKVPLPPGEEQDRISDIIDCIEMRLLEENQAQGAGRELKRALMSVLLTGEVRVKPDEEAA